ncbi:MAG TPA: hypothetical protein VF101_14090 [Gaiellaceae bacterium]
MGYVGGVVAFNAVCTAVGFCVLAPALRGLGTRTIATYAGVALLTGTGVVGVALCVVAPFGPRIGLVAFAVTAAVLVAAGLAAARFLSPLARARPLAAPAPSRLADAVATAAAAGIAVVLVLVLVGGFRSSPWLDDTWYFWLPKGRALDTVGLDPRLWRPDPSLHMIFGRDYESLYFIRPDNPLWWSIVLNLVMRFVGTIDMRAVNGELAFLLVGFVGATARLLWGRVRTWLLLPGLLLLLSAPELLRQTQGGDADVPLAIYLALALLAGAGWLAERSRFALLLVFLFAATAIQIKSEGVLELGLYLAILSLLAWPARRALLSLWCAAALAFATTVPWLVWRSEHDVSNVFSLRNALSPSYLRAHTDLLRGARQILWDNFTSVHKWSLLVLLAVALGIAAAVRDRRPVWLAPPAFLAAGYAFFVWITWADPEGRFRLVASAYRYVTPPIVLAAVFLPLLAERVVAPRPKTTGSASASAATK